MIHNALIFPGQGSQSVGMLAELAENFPAIKRSFAQVSETLGFDCWQLAQQGPEETLNKTENTQVLMLTADVAVYRVLQEQGLSACKMMAGHSLGEYAALVCADALDLEDAARLVAKRGQLMQQAIPLGRGAMAAIVGLSDEQVRQICQQASQAEQQVTAANYNAIGQVVIAGHSPAVERALQLAMEQDARMARIIPVSVPCHCPLLKEASEQFAENLMAATFRVPVVEVVSNVDLSIYQTTDQIRERLKEQLYSPVRWVETIQLMKTRGVECFVETGPGKVLTGLGKRIDRQLTFVSVNDLQSLEQLKRYQC